MGDETSQHRQLADAAAAVADTGGGGGGTGIVGELNVDDYECMLCLRLLYEPCTFKCGHSFCHDCCIEFYTKSLVNSQSIKCPTCRQVLPPTTIMKTTYTLSKLLQATFPIQYEQRRIEKLLEQQKKKKKMEMEEEEEQQQQGADTAAAATDNGTSSVLPIFYLDPILPKQRMILNIYEPRYVIMITRCLENGNGKFGMVGAISSGSRDRAKYGVEVKIVESTRTG